MQQKYIGISQSFFAKQDYIRNYDLILQRENLYEEFLKFIRYTYTNYVNFANSFPKDSTEPKQKSSIFESFRVFLSAFITLFKKVTVFEYNQIVALQEKKQDEVKTHFHNLIKQLQDFQPKQKNYQMQIVTLNSKSTALKDRIKKIKDDKNLPINFFNENYNNIHYKGLEEALVEIETSYKSIVDGTDEMINRREHFYNQIDNFRKTITNHRFDILNRFKNVAQKKNEGFMMLFFILRENIKVDKINFVNSLHDAETLYQQLSRMKYEKSKIQLSKSTKNELMEFSKHAEDFIIEITNVTNEYNNQLLGILKFLKLFSNNLVMLRSSFRSQLDKFKAMILYSINTKFQVSLSPIKSLQQLFEVFETLTLKLTELEQRLRTPVESLEKFASEIKKQMEISISLLKPSNNGITNFTSSKSLEQNKKRITDRTGELQNLMNSSKLQQNLVLISDIFAQQFTNIVSWCEKRFPKKKKITAEDSFNLTMYSEDIEFSSEQKRSEQLWLYLSDKKLEGYKLANVDELRKQINTLKPVNPTQSKEIESFDALLATGSCKGKLTVCQDSINFTSSSNELVLKIKYQAIQSSQLKSNVFAGKYMNIQTNKGRLVFQQVSDLEKCRKSLVQAIEKVSNVVQIIEKRKQISIDSIQLAFIQERKLKIKDKLPDKNALNIKIGTQVLKDIRIDQAYSQIYSDEEKVIKGKRYDSFFVYFTTRGNNIKIKSTKYEPKGPKFYTLNEDITFQNCELISERLLEYDHPLPKVNIPMMPKFCQCKETQKIFWVSNQQFHFYIQCRNSGAPYTTSFFVKILHIVKKKGENVEIQMMGGVEFVQEPMIKAMLKEKSQFQIKQNGDFFVNVLKQRIYSLKNNPAEEEKQIQPQKLIQKKNPAQEIEKELQNMKKQKKMIIGAAIIIFILSILIRLM